MSSTHGSLHFASLDRIRRRRQIRQSCRSTCCLGVWRAASREALLFSRRRGYGEIRLSPYLGGRSPRCNRGPFCLLRYSEIEPSAAINPRQQFHKVEFLVSAIEAATKPPRATISGVQDSERRIGGEAGVKQHVVTLNTNIVSNSSQSVSRHIITFAKTSIDHTAASEVSK